MHTKTLQTAHPLVTLNTAARFFIEDNRHCPCVATLWERRGEYNPIWAWSTFRRKVERCERQRELHGEAKYIRQKKAARKAHESSVLDVPLSERRFRASERRVAAFLSALPEGERMVAEWLLQGKRLSQLAAVLNVSRMTLSKRRRRVAAALCKVFPALVRRMLRKRAVFRPTHYTLVETFIHDNVIVKVYKG